MNSKNSISIVICTLGRHHVLEPCLRHLRALDNAEKATLNLVLNSKEQPLGFTNLLAALSDEMKVSVHHEPEIGLSHARNTGMRESHADWLVYIDDDVLVPPDYLEKIYQIIQNNPLVDCFGGPYYARFDFGKPNWLPDGFGSKPWLAQKASELSTGYLSGGNFIIKKKSLLQVGGFPIKYGMQGNRLGYGEEDYVQECIRSSGGSIWFYPNLHVDHLISPRKLKLPWHLKHAYRSGRDQLTPPNLLVRFYKLLHATLGSILKRLPLGIVKVLHQKSYYWQNLVLDTSTPILYAWGLLFARKNLQNSVS